MVAVAVAVRVRVAVNEVPLGVRVTVGVNVAVSVPPIGVAVMVAVRVAVKVAVGVNVKVPPLVAVLVAVKVIVGENVAVGELPVGVAVVVFVRVAVLVQVAVKVGDSVPAAWAFPQQAKRPAPAKIHNPMDFLVWLNMADLPLWFYALFSIIGPSSVQIGSRCVEIFILSSPLSASPGRRVGSSRHPMPFLR